jgi:hypothetical protein
MNPNPNPAESNEFGMFAPTSAEEAASQSNTNRTAEVLVDILKPNIPKILWEEGDNWVRFINTRGNMWYRDVTYFEMRVGNKLARVAHQDQMFGDVNLLLAVQIGLYRNTQETRPQMRTRENPEGFSFREHRRAFMVAARWENTLSPFGIAFATLGKKSFGKGQKCREAWGDALIKLPAEMTVDPTLPTDEVSQPKPRWGAIFDPVDGMLVKCSFTNIGKKEISASFTPIERIMPLGDWELPNGQPAIYEQDDPAGKYRRGDPIRPVPAGSKFVPKPQYVEILRNVPNLKDCFRRLTIEEQMEMVRTFIPTDLLPYAEKIMQAKLGEGRSSRGQAKPANGTAPKTASPAASAAPAPLAPTVQLAVPADEPTQLGEADKLYLDFVKLLGPTFKQVGEEVARKLIKLSLVTPANVKQMASFQPEMLKTIAAAS